jgi:hypothetical protein
MARWIGVLFFHRGSAMKDPEMPNNPTDEIRARLSSVVARLSPIAHGSGPLDPADVYATLDVIDHEIGQVLIALKRLAAKP